MQIATKKISSAIESGRREGHVRVGGTSSSFEYQTFQSTNLLQQLQCLHAHENNRLQMINCERQVLAGSQDSSCLDGAPDLSAIQRHAGQFRNRITVFSQHLVLSDEEVVPDLGPGGWLQILEDERKIGKVRGKSGRQLPNSMTLSSRAGLA
ncbi:uncharacterized protein BKA55DRAFT_534780 [Fusarium redolens]|uniref:Uncharacterized protein n=1 Tax=Fusarium redolens TaxID=48865 RepID=A0A9P9HXM4_FUSRE|nr:uncharacterized protein BKA55DRAFT_534780 [Fusarium redolens]KAH7264817.1 hypothetical protein BKA55DRAFT_534780 [Fusarium redolens]